MKWVHQGCLREWRVVSKRADSFWRCEQCCTPYGFRRGPLMTILKSGGLRNALVGIIALAAFAAMYVLVSRVLEAHEAVVRLQIERLHAAGARSEMGNWHGAYDAALARLSPKTTEASVPSAAATVRHYVSDAPYDHAHSSVSAALERLGISRVLYPLPLAVACVGFVALFAENHAGSSLAGVLLAVSTALLYLHPSPLASFVYPLPAAFGVVSFVGGVHSCVTSAVEFVLRRFCSELLDHSAR